MAQTSTSGYGSAATRLTAMAVRPGMSTGTTTTASMPSSSMAARPARMDEPTPVPHALLITTVALPRSAVSRTCSAAAPNTTTICSQPASVIVSII